MKEYLVFLNLDGKRIAVYDNKKSGNAIIFIHGNSLDSRIFEKLFEENSLNDFRLIAFDLPGCGESKSVLENKTDLFEDFRELVVSLIKELQLVNYYVVAHSLGAHLAMHAIHEGFRPKAMVLTGTLPLKGVPDMQLAFNAHPVVDLITKGELNDDDIKSIDDLFSQGDKLIFPYGREMWQNTSVNFRSSILQSIANNVIGSEQEKIKKYNIPTLIINGKNDPLINKVFEDNLRSLNYLTIKDSENGGHTLPWEKPEEFSEEIRSFFNK